MLALHQYFMLSVQPLFHWPETHGGNSQTHSQSWSFSQTISHTAFWYALGPHLLLLFPPLNFTPTLLSWLAIWFLPFIRCIFNSKEETAQDSEDIRCLLNKKPVLGLVWWFNDVIQKADSTLPPQWISNPFLRDCQMVVIPLGNTPQTKAFAGSKGKEVNGFPPSFLYEGIKISPQVLNQLLFTKHMSTPRPITSKGE